MTPLKINMPINFKRPFNSEKNSVINGRMVIVYYSEIIEPSSFITVKIIVLLDLNVKLIHKKQKILATIPYYYPQIFQITSRFKKQTP